MYNNVRLKNIFKAAMLVDKRFCTRINSGEYIRIRDAGRHTHTKAILTITSYIWLVK